MVVESPSRVDAANVSVSVVTPVSNHGEEGTVSNQREENNVLDLPMDVDDSAVSWQPAGYLVDLLNLRCLDAMWSPTQLHPTTVDMFCQQ